MEKEKYCDEHTCIGVRLETIEDKVDKMDSRLWSIFVLLVVNLAGVVRILISNIK